MIVNLKELNNINTDDEIELTGGFSMNNYSNKARVYTLDDGDIFTINESTYQFENEMFHEVINHGYSFYIDGIGFSPIFSKTGIVYSLDEIDKMQ